MEATLRVYADLSLAEREIPVLSMLSMTEEALRSRAEKLCTEIQKNGCTVEVVKTKSVAGGGAVPGLELESYAIALTNTVSVEKQEKKLREQPVPIIGRIENDRLLLDVRTIFEDDFEYVAKAVADVSG
jgi:L-seryl-tRNA(Ser) seleniumtransferase